MSYDVTLFIILPWPLKWSKGQNIWRSGRSGRQMLKNSKKKYGVENWKVFTCISRRYLKSIYSNFLLIIGSPSESVWWPAGSYGIPKPVSGCPRTTGFQWKKGWRSQDTNGASSKNARSLDFHLDAEVDETKVQRSFCIKTSIIDDHNRPKWPQGNN